MSPESSALTIDSQALVDLPGPVTLLDVRSPAEFGTSHISGSVNVPLDVVKGRPSDVVSRLNGDPVVLVCQSGVRSVEAQRALTAAGAPHLRVLDGGVPAYAAAGGQIVSGKSKWSIERQVRLVAGSIVLSSIVASMRAPKARFVAGGIGAGLTFSALSNTCAMGKVLLMTPYNRGPRDRDDDFYLAQLDGRDH